MAAEVWLLERDLFDLGGEEVDTAQDDHVVVSAGDLRDTAHAWASRARKQRGEITRAVANHGERLFW